ncbi:MAG TPA: FadR/GntR family transcriptional regulator [Hyphomicrobiaceae bacterium]|nr:FadR/GntR family transcriptional regulator [Hyphomicrobiaceae bacterium]
MPLAAIEPRRLYRQIADQLRQLIDDGEYAVGDRLPTERELASKLKVSRPTVREALIALEVEGRLRIRVGSGIYVTEQRPVAIAAGAAPIEGAFEILRARALVESAVAEEAAQRATAKDVARIDSVLAEARRPSLSGDQTLAIDRRLHTAIAETLRNAVLVRFVGELFDLRMNPYFERLARHTLDGWSWKYAHEEHVAIRDAIAARDPAAARTAMHEHLKRSHRRFCRDFHEPKAASASRKPARRGSAARTVSSPQPVGE